MLMKTTITSLQTCIKNIFYVVQNNLITRTLVNLDTKNRSTLFNMFNKIFFAHLDFKICKLIVIFLTVCREINTQRFNTDVCVYFMYRKRKPKNQAKSCGKDDIKPEGEHQDKIHNSNRNQQKS